jgi:hypothetical protein
MLTKVYLTQINFCLLFDRTIYRFEAKGSQNYRLLIRLENSAKFLTPKFLSEQKNWLNFPALRITLNSSHPRTHAIKVPPLLACPSLSAADNFLPPLMQTASIRLGRCLFVRPSAAQMRWIPARARRLYKMKARTWGE